MRPTGEYLFLLADSSFYAAPVLRHVLRPLLAAAEVMTCRSFPAVSQIADCPLLCRPFKLVPKPDGRPAVEVTNGDKKQQFVSAIFSGFTSGILKFLQSAEELSAMVLTKMKETAEQYLGKKVK